MILVDAAGVTVLRPGRELFTDLSLTVATGDRVGIVGINGAGKSTLLRVIAGEVEPEAGTVRRGRDARVAFLSQRPELPPGSVRAAVGDGWEAAAVLDHLGMSALAGAEVARLSGGEAKRVALAQVLVTECDLLLLDEPTNHLDLDGIAWLEDRLAAFRGGLVLVTHDRHVLDRVATTVLEIDRGRSYLHDGGYAGYLTGRADRAERAAGAESVRRNLARKELAWLRRGAPARTRKPKARIEAATAIVESRPDAEARPDDLRLHFGTPRLGDKVIELRDASVAVGDGAERRVLFAGLDLALDNRERLGVVGPNGAGKSSLLDVLAGRRPPVAGTVEVGSTVRLGYYDQVGATLDVRQRVRDAVGAVTDAADWRLGALLERFWFDGDAQWAPIELLSGGEQRRLQLLLVLAAQPNVLLLDEPTNDLDLDTLRVLEDFLEEWPGALVVVSHDRAFLERTVTDVIVVDGSGADAGVGGAGRWPGGYAAWEAQWLAGRRRGGRAAAVVASDAGSAGRSPSGTAPAPIGATAGSGSEESREAAEAYRAAQRAKRGRSPSTVRNKLRSAEKRLETATTAHAAAEAAMATAATAGDHAVLASAAEALAGAATELADAEERWLALAAELDELGGA